MSEFDPDMVEFELDASERMSEQEALMWNVEKDPWLNPSGGALTITDRPPDADLLRRIMRHAVSGIPRMYQRVVPGLARISTPAWIPSSTSTTTSGSCTCPARGRSARCSISRPSSTPSRSIGPGRCGGWW